MKDGQQIRFSGEGDQSPGLEAGDVVIVLDEKEHNVFRRRGIDLLMQLEISLTEALCGFQHCIQTLDNRSLIIMSLPGRAECKLSTVVVVIRLYVRLCWCQITLCRVQVLTYRPDLIPGQMA